MQSRQEINTANLEIIEEAWRDQPVCTACGQSNHVVARGGIIWIECRGWEDRKSLISRVISATAGHTRKQLVDEPPRILIEI